MTDYAYAVGSTVVVTELGSREGELELPEGTRGVVLEIIENDEGFDQAEVDFGQYGVRGTYDDQVALVEDPAPEQIKVGDKVRLTGSRWGREYNLEPGTIVTVTEIDDMAYIIGDQNSGTLGVDGELYNDTDYSCELVEPVTPVSAGEIIFSPESLDRLASQIRPLLERLNLRDYDIDDDFSEYELEELDESGAVDPDHYKFPGGAEVRHISEWLTANAAQALQYIARSSRIDGNNKGDAREDLLKARKFIDFELERLDV